MVTFNGYDVELSRGDTLALKIELDGRDLPEGTDGVFTIKKRINMDEVVLQKRFDASDEVLTVVLDADETNIDPGTYYWDVRLQIPLENGGYEVYTPMEYAAFVVLPVVGVDIGTDGSNMVNPDLPVLQVVLAEMRQAIQDANDATDKANEAANNIENGADGKDGIGIERVEQTTTSTEDGGTNVITVTMTDGTSSVFEIRNGNAGTSGPQGDPGKDAVVDVTLTQSGQAADAGATGDALSQLSDNVSQLKEEVSQLQTKTGINYLRPTLGTTTINGVTCTNNGDGTYTLNGTSTDRIVFVFVDKDRWLQNAIVGKTVKFNCVQDGSSSRYFAYIYALAGSDMSQFDSNGVIFTPTNAVDYNITLQIMPNVTVNNIVVKPMITDDLSATYYDFVSYDDSFLTDCDVIDKSSIGDVWVAGTTFAEGDYCINGNRLYKCKTAHTAGSAFDVIYWDAVSIAGQLAKIIKAMNISI